MRIFRLWLLAALALVAIYAGQELLEGALAPGHAAGLAGVFGDGGWWALPAALLVAPTPLARAAAGRAPPRRVVVPLPA